MHITEKSLYLNISRIIWGFNISKKSVNGKLLNPRSKIVPGWMTIPQPFECDISVRSPKHAKLIEKIWKEAEGKITLDEKR
jgi:hypothetical protein